jgi:CDP-glucose 4,6-dehydratase
LEAMGSDLMPSILNQTTNEIKDQYLSAQKARNLLNWRPLYTLDEGVKETISWYENFFKNSI